MAPSLRVSGSGDRVWKKRRKKRPGAPVHSRCRGEEFLCLLASEQPTVRGWMRSPTTNRTFPPLRVTPPPRQRVHRAHATHVIPLRRRERQRGRGRPPRVFSDPPVPLVHPGCVPSRPRPRALREHPLRSFRRHGRVPSQRREAYAIAENALVRRERLELRGEMALLPSQLVQLGKLPSSVRRRNAPSRVDERKPRTSRPHPRHRSFSSPSPSPSPSPTPSPRRALRRARRERGAAPRGCRATRPPPGAST